jgi:hypothetical protein
MDSQQYDEPIEELDYLLGRISKYLKNNQYVYLRAFVAWQETYNVLATRLNGNKVLSVPLFKLGPIDYSPSGKSIKMTSVDKFVKTIRHQVTRLQERREELQRETAAKLILAPPLEQFFHRNAEGQPLEPPLTEKRVFVAIPAGEAELRLFWQGIQPALETQGLSFFRADRPLLDDAALSEICRELSSCRLAIFNLAGQAANVLLALGLAYGIGKALVILQPQDEIALGAAVNSGYLRYSGAADLKSALRTLLPQLLAN